MKVIGIDMTQSSKPCSLAVLDSRTEKPAIVDTRDIGDDDTIVQFCSGAKVVAIDSPLFLPLGLCCLEESCGCKPALNASGRECERLLSGIGISSYYTTKKTFIKPMIYRSMSLASRIASKGTSVIEVYPYASGVFIIGDKLPSKRKNRKEYCEVIAEKMSELVASIGPIRSADHADAILAAYTGCLWLRGQAEAIGLPDEGFLWMPSRIYPR